MHVEKGGVRLDHTLDLAEIGAVRATVGTGRSAGIASPRWRTVGLTVAEFRFSKSTRGRMAAAGPGKWCVHVTHVDLRIGFTDQTVYIPRGYPVGGCEYAAILEHEQAHVEDNLAVLEGFTQTFQREAHAVATKLNPMTVTSKRQAREKPLEKLSRGLAPLVRDFQATQARYAARRDTREHYAAVSRRCTNW